MKMIFLVMLIAFAGCIGGAAAKNGDKVSVNYVGTLADGTVFDTSYEAVAREKGKYDANRKYEPLAFTIGAGQMIKGFDEGVVGMREGEEKVVTMPPEKAYGQYDPKLKGAVPRIVFEQNGLEPVVGRAISIKGMPARIVSFNSTDVLLDLNHELAGKTLTFKIRLEKINPGG